MSLLLLRRRGRWARGENPPPARFADAAAAASAVAAAAALSPRAAARRRVFFLECLPHSIAITNIVISGAETRRLERPRHGAGGERQGLEQRWRQRRKRKKKRGRRRRVSRNAVAAAALFVSPPLCCGRGSSASGPLEAREGSAVALVAVGDLFFFVCFRLRLND